MENKPDKIKILFVITKSNWGGAQRYVYDLATGLDRERFDVAVALGGAGTLIQKLNEQNIRVISISSLIRDVNIASDITAFFEIWSIFQREKPDVVHLNSAKAAGVGALAARLVRVPKIIFTAHGWAFNEDRAPLSCTIFKIISWITMVLSHKTIAVSDAVKNDVIGWPLIGKKIFTVKNGVAEPKFFTREDARARLFARRRRDIPFQSPVFAIGTIAELHKNKGLVYAIEAFAKLAPENPSLYHFIIGDGEEKENLSALIDRRNLRGRVFLLGFMEDASRLLPAFDMFILPSTKEGLPYAILEAGLAGLPVIATSVGGIPEIIENEKTGLLVPPRNSNAIVSAVKKLSESPTLKSVLGTALREKVLRDFSLERVISETTTLYEKISE